MNMRYVVLLLLLCLLSAVGAGAVDISGEDFGSFSSAKWIWYPEGNPADTAPRGDVTFFKTFNIANIAQVAGCAMAISVDDDYVLYLNGTKIASGEGWSRLGKYDLLPYLENGNNTIAVVATNRSSGPAGFLAKIITKLRSGKSSIIVTDGSWLCVRDSKSVEVPAGKLPKSRVTANAGSGPWGVQDWMLLPDDSMNIPKDFPRFIVPGYDKEMNALRRMYWTSYRETRKAGLPTLWDAWMVSPSLAPMISEAKGIPTFAERWSRTLSDRYMDTDGYISTHQHISHAHDLGWPFPLWAQVAGNVVGNGYTAGWHFNDELPAMMNGWTGVLRGSSMAGEGAIKAWSTYQMDSKGLVDNLWQIKTTGTEAAITSPEGIVIDSFCAPFIQIRLSRNPKPSKDSVAYIEWIGDGDADFSTERRIEFPIEGINPWGYQPDVKHCVIPMYKHPLWKGKINRMRFVLAPGENDVTFAIDSIFTAFDTRHTVNNSSFIIGCADNVRWTGDIGFLSNNIEKMRKAMKFNLTDLGGAKNSFIKCDWVGHDGKPGYSLSPEGERTLYYGQGVGSNYWDLLPIGNEDMYATTYYYQALMNLAEIEDAARKHPEWKITPDPELTPEYLRNEAEKVKAEVNKRFWNSEAGRFVACIDTDGKAHDYGYTFLNLEAIAYGIASNAHSRSIMQWIDGDRIVESDTAKGEDIYHWVFAPRATTKRNADWYFWGWEGFGVPWGNQVQDGGAVLGFSYHDLMSRLKINGPNDAWQRCKAIAQWYDMVIANGGVRKYYASSPGGGNLQGGGVAGGLGIDFEFYETILAPYTLINGFLGYNPRIDGFDIKPRIPKQWPNIRVTQLRFKQAALNIKAAPRQITIECKGTVKGRTNLYVDKGNWKITESAGTIGGLSKSRSVQGSDTISVNIKKGNTIILDRE